MSAKNRLLAILCSGVYEKLVPKMKRVWLEQGNILQHPGETIRVLYFPINCLISSTIMMSDGLTAETGVVGNREVVGVNAFMSGSETTQRTYIVQMAGSALKVDARPLLEEFERNKHLRDVLLRYTQALIAQISQTTACNSLHTLEQRLARWLLEAQNRVESNELKLTQEFIADMLSVRRADVAQAAQKLQESGLLRYRREHIKLLEQRGLEAASCECFRTVKDQYERLLGASNEPS